MGSAVHRCSEFWCWGRCDVMPRLGRQAQPTLRRTPDSCPRWSLLPSKGTKLLYRRDSNTSRGLVETLLGADLRLLRGCAPGLWSRTEILYPTACQMTLVDVAAFRADLRLNTVQEHTRFFLFCLELTCAHRNFLTVCLKLAVMNYSWCPRIGCRLQSWGCRMLLVCLSFCQGLSHIIHLWVSECVYVYGCMRALVCPCVYMYTWKLENNFRELVLPNTWALEIELRRQAWQPTSFPIESSPQLLLLF